mmetsp:Transcript_3712/g.4738  ORF Transcript_3712/g.4738 Transcript_3712/m.4738 type:complete len:91 (-) Transcript_3712:597-869(-)
MEREMVIFCFFVEVTYNSCIHTERERETCGKLVKQVSFFTHTHVVDGSHFLHSCASQDKNKVWCSTMRKNKQRVKLQPCVNPVDVFRWFS